jgi:hypothetical protein
MPHGMWHATRDRSDRIKRDMSVGARYILAAHNAAVVAAIDHGCGMQHNRLADRYGKTLRRGAGYPHIRTAVISRSASSRKPIVVDYKPAACFAGLDLSGQPVPLAVDQDCMIGNSVTLSLPLEYSVGHVRLPQD